MLPSSGREVLHAEELSFYRNYRHTSRRGNEMRNGRAARVCAADGCNELVMTGSRCTRHALVTAQQAAQRDKQKRGTAKERGYDGTWRRLRDKHIHANPLCAHCLLNHRVVPGTQVDHRIPHCGDESLRLDPNNLQTLCARCHSIKTTTEDGGFGRPRIAR